MSAKQPGTKSMDSKLLSAPRLKGSERQKMLVDYVKEGTVPEGFYVKISKNGLIQFRKIKQKDPESLIKKYEEKIKKLKSTGSESTESPPDSTSEK